MDFVVPDKPKDDAFYKSFEELSSRLNLKSLEGWETNVDTTKKIVTLKLVADSDSLLPKFKIAITENLKFCGDVYRWHILPTHRINTTYKQSVKHITVANLTQMLKMQRQLKNHNTPFLE